MTPLTEAERELAAAWWPAARELAFAWSRDPERREDAATAGLLAAVRVPGGPNPSLLWNAVRNASVKIHRHAACQKRRPDRTMLQIGSVMRGHSRRQLAMGCRELVDPVDRRDDQAAADARDAADALLARLRPAARAVAALVAVEGLTQQEAARRLGISQAEASRRLRTARRRLTP